MRVLLCTTTFAQANTGAARFARSVAQLSSFEPAVRVLVLSEEIDELNSGEGYNVHLTGLARIPGISYYAKSRLYSNAIEKILQKQTVDIILMNDAWLAAHWLKKNRSIPVVVFVHDDTAMFSLQNTLGAIPSLLIRRSLEGFAVKRATAVITNSEYMRSMLSRNYKVPERRISSLPLAFVDYDHVPFKFRPIDHREPIRVLFMKSNFRRGGLLPLIHALKQMTKYRFKLTIIGPGENTIRKVFLKELPARLNVEFSVLGPVSDHQKVLNVMNEQNLFCVPSRREAFGVAYHEALAVGLPVIYNDTGGIPSEMRRYGFPISELNPTGISKAVERVINSDVGMLERRIYNGRQWVLSHFGYAKMQQKLLSRLQALMPPHTQSPSQPEFERV